MGRQGWTSRSFWLSYSLVGKASTDNWNQRWWWSRREAEQKHRGRVTNDAQRPHSLVVLDLWSSRLWYESVNCSRIFLPCPQGFRHTSESGWGVSWFCFSWQLGKNITLHRTEQREGERSFIWASWIFTIRSLGYYNRNLIRRWRVLKGESVRFAHSRCGCFLLFQLHKPEEYVGRLAIHWEAWPKIYK